MRLRLRLSDDQLGRLTRLVIIGLLIAASTGMGLGAEYHGNRKSKVFHREGCQHYHCANCTAIFNSVEEAVAAGYRPCGICRSGGTVSDGRKASGDGAAPYVGNTKSRVFHRRSCRHAGCTNCTVSFTTREEAIAAGYRPGGCCNP